MSIEEAMRPQGSTADSGSAAQAAERPSNVLAFPGAVARPSGRSASVFVELQALLDIYDHLIALLRETDNDGLDMLTDSMVVSVVNCRTTLAAGCNEAEVLNMMAELRAGLHEIPRTLRALLPGLGPRLGESLEHRLGIQFSSC